MELVENCLQTLRSLIDAGQVHSLQRAEAAINEFIDAQPDAAAKITALGALEGALLELPVSCDGLSDRFVSSVLDYIDRRFADLR